MTTAVATRSRTTGVVAASYVGAALLLLHGLWANPNNRYLVDGGQDQEQWQWFFDVTAHQFLHGQNPLFTTLLNFPDGVNLMANTAMFGLGVPLIPVTTLLGSGFTWAIVLTLGLAGSAFAWYWLFRQRLSVGQFPAALGAAFCGFAPAIISHANAHPNFVVLAVIPLLLLRRSPGRRTAIVLGLLIAYQLFLGEEVLLLSATGLAIFGAAYAWQRPDLAVTAVRQYWRTVTAAGGLAFAIGAVPLAWQFFGPQSYHALLHGAVGNPLAAFTSFSSRSLIGGPTAGELSMNPTEENAFFGWPLLLVVAAIVIALRRRPVVRALAVLVLVAGWLSMGPLIKIAGAELPGPWALVSQLPLFESVIESRMAMVCIPALGALLALGIDRLLSRPDRWTAPGLIVVLTALLPILPTPLETADRRPVPEFFTSGQWRNYVTPGGTLVPAPPPDPVDASPMRWQAAAGFGFALPEGYFVGPWGPGRQGGYGAEPRPTAAMMRRADCGLSPPEVRADLEYWRADAIVLRPGWEVLRDCLDSRFGPGEYTGGVWVWRVRGR